MSQRPTNFSFSSPSREACRGHQWQTEVGRMPDAWRASIALLLICTGSVLGQSPTGQTPTESQSARKIAIGRPLRPPDIPEAALPSTPEEAKWWEDLRKAAKAVQERRDGRKEEDKFLSLLYQGQEESYRPPIPDSRVIILSKAEPMYSEKARAKGIKGTVVSMVEFRPDGFIGEVEIVQGLGYGLDENVAQSARHTVFLPAVKDRKFVSFRTRIIMTFNIY